MVSREIFLFSIYKDLSFTRYEMDEWRNSVKAKVKRLLETAQSIIPNPCFRNATGQSQEETVFGVPAIAFLKINPS